VGNVEQLTIIMLLSV